MCKENTMKATVVGGALAALYVLCSVVAWVVPGPYYYLKTAMMHQSYNPAPFSLEGFVLGLLGWFVVGAGAYLLYKHVGKMVCGDECCGNCEMEGEEKPVKKGKKR